MVMRFSVYFTFFAIALEAVSARSRSLQHVGRSEKKPLLPNRREARPEPPKFNKRQSSSSPYLTDLSAKFVVNGTAIPDVDFDVGESYAGLMPISPNASDTNQLYFWFFPTDNPLACDEILIWLNGGPGCSSLEGLLQENGPFLWQYGTFAPVANPYTWKNLTNVVWVEQPVGTGFSQGTPTATGETDVASQFLGFWENFMDTFDLHGRKVYITGESYAGMYVPYIADAMLNTNDTTYFNVEGTLIHDPTTTSQVIQDQIPAVAFWDYWAGLMPFNDSFVDYIHNKSDACGYTDFLNDYLVFPPNGLMPSKLPGTDSKGETLDSCDVYDDIQNAALVINPCWDVYQVATTCPVLWDVLGFPGSFNYLPVGASIYFNRTDVQKAINAPVGTNWEECTDTNVFPHGDHSPKSGAYNGPLSSVIERSKRSMIVHGALDMILILNGTLLMIQNMTWNGAQGFQSTPVDPFYVPFHDDPNPSTLAGSGVFGTTHTERGLTWVAVDLSGHMIPQYAPSASYRILEFLLGRIDSLSSTAPFTTDPFPQSNGTLGNGNAPPEMRLL